MEEKELERSNLMKELVNCVNLCQLNYGPRKELAKEDDSWIFTLCKLLEAVLQHGIKTSISQNTSSFSIYNLAKKLPIQEKLTFFELICEILSKDEKQRYLDMMNIKTNEGRGRAWIRNALNEHTLEQCFYTIVNDDELLRKFYEEWAFMRDVTKAIAIPNIASGLSSILFAIKINELSLDEDHLNLNFLSNLNQKVQGIKNKKKKVEAKILDWGEEYSKSLIESKTSYFSNNDDQVSLKSNKSISSTKSDNFLLVKNKEESQSLKTDKPFSKEDSTVENENKMFASNNNINNKDKFFSTSSKMMIVKKDDDNDEQIINSTTEKEPLKPNQIFSQGSKANNNLDEASSTIFTLELEDEENFTKKSQHLSTSLLPENLETLQNIPTTSYLSKYVKPSLLSSKNEDISFSRLATSVSSSSFVDALREKDASSESYGSYDSNLTSNGCLSPSAFQNSQRNDLEISSTNMESLTFDELKNTLITIMLYKDKLLNENNYLKDKLNLMKENIHDLKNELEVINNKILEDKKREQEDLNSLSRENEILKLQLRKYVSLLQSNENINNHINIGPESNETLNGMEEKLAVVAEMNGELHQLNDSLRLELARKNLELQKMKLENLSANSQTSLATTSICIPSAFLRTLPSDAYYVYQVYINIGTDQWNIYRRYTDFLKMHCKLMKTSPVIKTFNFPPKAVFNNKDTKFVDMRKKRLDFYLKQLLQHLFKHNELLRKLPNKHSLVCISSFFREDVRTDQ